MCTLTYTYTKTHTCTCTPINTPLPPTHTHTHTNQWWIQDFRDRGLGLGQKPIIWQDCHLLRNGILSHCRIFEGPRPVLMVHDTEFLKQVFAKKGANFKDRRVTSTFQNYSPITSKSGNVFLVSAKEHCLLGRKRGQNLQFYPRVLPDVYLTSTPPQNPLPAPIGPSPGQHCADYWCVFEGCRLVLKKLNLVIRYNKCNASPCREVPTAYLA